MEKWIEDLPFQISAADAELLDDAFADFETDAAISADMQQRICSSVMRKAGFEMDETKQVTPKKKKMTISRMLSIGAVAFLEENDITAQQEGESAHYRFYLDTMISDGNFCRIVFCYEALDDAAVEKMQQDSVFLHLKYTDTGEKISTWQSEQQNVALDDERHSYADARFSLLGVDTTRPVTAWFDASTVLWWNDGDEAELTDHIEIPIDCSPNVMTKIIVDEQGRELLLSPLGISSFAPTEELEGIGASVKKPVRLQYSDGTEILSNALKGFGASRNTHQYAPPDEDPLYGMTEMFIFFGDLLNIEDCTAVEIGDTMFCVKDEE